MFKDVWGRRPAAAFGVFCILLVGAALIPAAPKSAQAHHGWSWTTGKNIELNGVIRAVDLGNPHGKIMLDVNGTWWTLEVGQPWRNERAGLKDSDLAEGVRITVSGEPSRDPDAKRLKVERLWINGVRYDLYPDRA